MRLFRRLRSAPAARARHLRKRAGLQTWARPLGTSGLPAEAEAWVAEIEHGLRQEASRLRDIL